MTAADAWIRDRRTLLDAATEGPWFQGREEQRYESTQDVYSKREPDEEDSHDIAIYIWSAGDAALISDSRTSLPKALDAIEAVLELLEETEAKGRTLQMVPELKLAGNAYIGTSERARAAITEALS